MLVTIKRILTGPAAAIGAVRFNIGADEAVILLNPDLPLHEQADLLGELLHEDDTICYDVVNIPGQRQPSDVPAVAAG